MLAAPIAAADFYVLTHDRTLNGNSVLGNDTDPDHDPLTAALLTDVAHGTLSLNPNGTFQYVPGVHYAGPDSFTYRAFDGTNYSAPATVTFTVTNSTPAAVGDSYTIYKDVWDSAVEGSLSLLNNDMDQDGDSLAASLVAAPMHGTLSLNANGSFVYTPNVGYFGPDAWTYRVSDGVTFSAPATVNFDVTSPFSAQTNGNDQPIAAGQAYGPFAVSPLTGGTQSSLQVAPGHLLQYSSITADPRPVIAIETSWNPLTPAPLGIEATLTLNGVQGQTVYFQGANVVAGDKLRFALQADATALPTGHYNWSVTLLARYAGSTTSTRMYTGVSDVLNYVANEIGAGWSLAELNRLVPVNGGQLLVSGSGSALYFQDNGSNTFTSPAGPLAYATLVRNADQTFTLTSKTREKENFNALGMLTSRVDLNANTVTYSYIDANSDGQARELQKITDPFGRITTFVYSGGKLSSVKDLANRTTNIARDAAGRLTSITAPDPDGTLALTRPLTAFAYDTANRLTSITDPVNQQTQLQYAVSQAGSRPRSSPMATRNSSFPSRRRDSSTRRQALAPRQTRPRCSSRVSPISSSPMSSINRKLRGPTGLGLSHTMPIPCSTRP